MLVGLGWMARTAISEHEKVFVRTPLNRPIMLYVAACVLATLIGVLVEESSRQAACSFS